MGFLNQPKGWPPDIRLMKADHIGFQVVLDEIGIKLFTTAFIVPGQIRELIHASDAWLVGKQISRRAFAREEVRPGETAFDQALVDGILNVEETGNCADRQDFGLQIARRTWCRRWRQTP